jgi:hypothetical protein
MSHPEWLRKYIYNHRGLKKGMKQTILVKCWREGGLKGSTLPGKNL